MTSAKLAITEKNLSMQVDSDLPISIICGSQQFLDYYVCVVNIWL